MNDNRLSCYSNQILTVMEEAYSYIFSKLEENDGYVSKGMNVFIEEAIDHATKEAAEKFEVLPWTIESKFTVQMGDIKKTAFFKLFHNQITGKNSNLKNEFLGHRKINDDFILVDQMYNQILSN